MQFFSRECLTCFPACTNQETFFVRNIVSYQCFVMFPSGDKLGNIFVRNIVSYQCFVTSLSVDKLGNIFVRNIGSFETKQVLFSKVSKKGKVNWKHDVPATCNVFYFGPNGLFGAIK